MPFKTSEERRKYYQKNKEHVLAKQKEWRNSNPEKKLEYNKKYRQTESYRLAKKKDREIRREYYVNYNRKRIGIILESINRPEPECCENPTCNYKPTKEGRDRLVCDHDHKTGLFRFWLCNRCNIMLGGYENALEFGIPELLSTISK